MWKLCPLEKQTIQKQGIFDPASELLTELIIFYNSKNFIRVCPRNHVLCSWRKILENMILCVIIKRFKLRDFRLCFLALLREMNDRQPYTQKKDFWAPDGDRTRNLLMTSETL